MKKKLLILASLSASLMVACSRKQEAAPNNIMNAQAGETIQKMFDKNGQVIGTVTEKLTEEQLEKARKETQETTLVTAAIDTYDLVHSRELFRINGTADDRKVYLAPRILVLHGSGIDTTYTNSDNTVTIPFKVAITDGLQKFVTTPGAKEAKTFVPSDLALDDNEKRILAERIKARYGNAVLAGMRGCPSALYISVDGEKYNVTPDAFNSSDYCQMNKPFSVSLRLPAEKARLFLTKLLPSYDATLYMNFALQVPTVIGRVSVNLDRSKFFEALKAQFQNKSLVSKVEIKASLEQLLSQNRFNITMVGSMNEMVGRLLPEIIENFFSTPDELGLTHLQDQSCGDGQACFMLNAARVSESKYLNFEFANVAATRLTQVLESHSELVPATQVTQKVGEPNATDDGGHLKNRQEIRWLGLSATRGSSLKINIIKYFWENYQTIPEKHVEGFDKIECGKWFLGSCDHNWEIHYHLFTRHSFEWTPIDNPLSYDGSIMNQLEVVFKFNNGRIKTCSLSNLARSNGSELTLFIENTNGCEVYGSAEESIYNIGLISRINRGDRAFIKGERVTSEHHPQSPRNTYAEVTYNPEVRLALEVKMEAGFVSKSLLEQQ